MRILFLAHRIPYPPNKGDKIRSYHVLRELAKRHEVHLGCLIDDDEDLAYVTELAGLVGRVEFARVAPALGCLKAAPAMLRRRALSVSYFHSPRLQAAVDDMLASGDIGAIFCSSSPMAEYLFRSREAARVRAAVRLMDLIDVDSEKWLQYARRSPPWSAWLYRREARCLRRYERRILEAFDRVLVVTEAERDLIAPAGDAGRAVVAIPNGVDLERFSPRHRGRFDGPAPLLVFTGVMDYWPNVDGIGWFVERVFPLIRASVPAVRLLIVGNRPTARVRSLGAVAGVTVTGFVPDVRDYLAAASVCIVPLRIARGIQNKLLEAMAMGKPVVSTPAAFEGLRARADQDLLVAAEEQAFAEAVVALLSDERKSAELGFRARACVERSYRWDQNLRPLEELLQIRTS
jgi:polysaccharide biosynthesis protein PslH